MLALPIDTFLPEVVQRLSERPNLVLVAEPGAGKTTRVPPAIVEAGILPGAHPAVVVLQPRRVAARAAAERIAEERNWRLGEQVGYHVRFERRLGPRTPLRILTEAILSRQLLADPELAGVGCVVLDEFHERSIHCDLAIALLREVQQSLRPDLRLVVMSATLDAGPVAAFLGDAAVLRVPGRVFPVVTRHREATGGPLEEQLARAVQEVVEEPGDMLCFLPGAEEIRRAGRTVARVAPEAMVLPLHGSLAFEEQRRALVPHPRRKIVLATNIAETSLTIDGVRIVIDSGLARTVRFDPARGVERLSLGRISRASADQRRGRAGRTAPGLCLRLWNEKLHHDLPDFEVPELCRVDLASTILMLLSWGVRDVSRFGWFEPPEAGQAASALRLLGMLGAVRESGGEARITPLGHQMARLPLHPRLARALLAFHDRGQSRDGALIAALLSERDVLASDRSLPRGPTRLADSDLTHRLHLLEAGRLDEGQLDVPLARQILRARDELLERLGPPGRPGLIDPLLLAYPDRVCLRRSTDPAAGIMVGGVGVSLAPESHVRTGELFLALDVRDDDRAAARQATVSLAHAVTLAGLRAAFPGAVTRQRDCVYDAGRDRVVGRVQTRYLDLVVEESDDAAIDDAAAAEVLLEALLPGLEERMARDESARGLLARLRLAHAHLPPPWPAPPWEGHREALLASLAGRRSLADFDPHAFLLSLLTHAQRQVLDREVPERWSVPTGSRIRIDYTAAAPTLAVRIQELFGASVPPRICRGKVPLTLHLLSPGYKPVQVTQDLPGFWQRTYPQVRKELRARYPRHSWPEDPLAAPPVRKGRSEA